MGIPEEPEPVHLIGKGQFNLWTRFRGPGGGEKINTFVVVGLVLQQTQGTGMAEDTLHTEQPSSPVCLEGPNEALLQQQGLHLFSSEGLYRRSKAVLPAFLMLPRGSPQPQLFHCYFLTVMLLSFAL